LATPCKRRAQEIEVVVEFRRPGRRLAGNLAAEFAKLRGQLLNPFGAAVEERNHIGPGLAEEFHGQGRLLGAIRHRLETGREIPQHLVGRAQIAVGLAEGDAERGKEALVLARSGGRFEHRRRQFLERGGKGLGADVLVLRGEFQRRQGFDADAGLLRQLVELVGGVDTAFHQGGEARAAQGDAKVTEQAVDRPGVVGECPQVALDRRKGRARLVNGGDEDLGAVGHGQVRVTSGWIQGRFTFC
jgi:hypothetical protein